MHKPWSSHAYLATPATHSVLPQVALIGDAMDIHGFVTEQQFRDIVEVGKPGWCLRRAHVPALLGSLTRTAHMPILFQIFNRMLVPAVAHPSHAG